MLEERATLHLCASVEEYGDNLEEGIQQTNISLHR